MIIKMGISRVREYAADKGGAEISGKPLGLASALNKLQNGVQQIPMRTGRESDSHMFIINPFFGGMQKLFSTHPPTEERIRRLKELADRHGLKFNKVSIRNTRTRWGSCTHDNNINL